MRITGTKFIVSEDGKLIAVKALKEDGENNAVACICEIEQPVIYGVNIAVLKGKPILRLIP